MEELQAAIDKYLKDYKDEGYTITGLALGLGFESRQSLYDYKERDQFSYTIKRACLYVENGYERNLKENASAGSIFALKNMGWSDKLETDNKHSGDMVINFTEKADRD